MSSEKALRTRAAIIAAARGIILKEGIGALTMDRAAQAAGMSKGACMYHRTDCPHSGNHPGLVF